MPLIRQNSREIITRRLNPGQSFWTNDDGHLLFTMDCEKAYPGPPKEWHDGIHYLQRLATIPGHQKCNYPLGLRTQNKSTVHFDDVTLTT